MSVKIRLKRLGKIRVPQYRIVVVDSRKKRDGRVLEEIGKYHPKEDPSFIQVTSDRAQYWLGVGAQPTEPVAAILKITGDWQTFKGLPGTEGTLRVAAEKRSKLDLFNEALKDAASQPKSEAVTKKADKKAASKAEAPKDKPATTAKAKSDDKPKADDEPKTDKPKADEPKTDEPKADDTAPAAAEAPAEVPADETPEVAAENAEAAADATEGSAPEPDKS